MEHLVRPFIAVFSDVPDFRHAQGKRYQLPLVLTLVTLTMISQQNTLGQGVIEFPVTQLFGVFSCR